MIYMRKVPSGSNIPVGTFFYGCIPQLFGEYFHRVFSKKVTKD